MDRELGRKTKGDNKIDDDERRKLIGLDSMDKKTLTKLIEEAKY